MKLNIVPASTGFTWVKLGITTFFKQPVALGGLFFMSLALTQILAIVPFIGIMVAMVIFPATTLGMMVATLQALQGKFPMPNVLTSAFRLGKERSVAMLKLGVMYAVGLLVVVTLVALIDGGELAKELSKSPVPSPAIMELPNFLPTLLTGLGLYSFLSILFWHAPALVHWHKVPPSKAVFFSLVACLRNWAAYAVFGLTWTAVFFVGSTLIGALSALLGLGQGAGLILLPLILIMVTMFVCSIYFTFRDSFSHTDAEEPIVSESLPPNNDL
jgi:hypothetical protein